MSLLRLVGQSRRPLHRTHKLHRASTSKARDDEDLIHREGHLTLHAAVDGGPGKAEGVSDLCLLDFGPGEFSADVRRDSLPDCCDVHGRYSITVSGIVQADTPTVGVFRQLLAVPGIAVTCANAAQRDILSS